MIDTLLQIQTETPDVAWSMISPLVVLAIGGILLITITSLVPSLKANWFPAAFTAGTALLAGGFVVSIWNKVQSGDGAQLVVSDALMVDEYTLFVTGVICVAVFFVSLLFHGYLERERFSSPEWYVLVLMSASGGILLASAEDLIVAFVGLEILSIAVYVLASLHLRRSDSQEAGFKYFLLGALASALFLYGIALTYGATGSTTLSAISSAGVNERGLSPAVDSSMILVAMALLLVGFAFKVSAVPFHLWTPDVYQGSPSPVVAFMASAVKVAGFAGLVRVFFVGFGPYVGDWRPVLQGLAIASLVVGSFLAVAQDNVKRMLAYSSITHAGFILIGIYAAADQDGSSQGVLGSEAFLFYLLSYTVMVAGTFGVVTLIGRVDDGRHSLADYKGLSKANPVLAVLMSVLLFAQAGIPFTSGFLAKFRVIAAAADSEAYILAGIAMLASVVAAVLYLRVVVSMFLAEPESNDEQSDDALPTGLAGLPPVGIAAVGLAVVVTIALGVLPFGQQVLTDAAEAVAAMPR